MSHYIRCPECGCDSLDTDTLTCKCDGADTLTHCEASARFDAELSALKARLAEAAEGYAALRRGLRDALAPTWPSNPGVGDDEIVAATRRLSSRASASARLAEELASYIRVLHKDAPQLSITKRLDMSLSSAARALVEKEGNDG